MNLRNVTLSPGGKELNQTILMPYLTMREWIGCSLMSPVEEEYHKLKLDSRFLEGNEKFTCVKLR